jgi:DNA-binding MarR family transcriptional regulator
LTVIHTFNVVTKKLERRLGLSGSKLEILECLRDNPGLPLSHLATRSSTPLSTVSVVVPRLVDRGGSYAASRRPTKNAAGSRPSP